MLHHLQAFRHSSAAYEACKTTISLPSAWTMQSLSQAVSCFLWPGERKLTWQLGQKWHWQKTLFYVCGENDQCLREDRTELLSRRELLSGPTGQWPQMQLWKQDPAKAGCRWQMIWGQKECKLTGSNYVEPTQFTRTSSLVSKADLDIMMGSWEN